MDTPQQGETWVNNATGEEAQIVTLSVYLVELSNGIIVSILALTSDWTRKE